MNTAPIQSKVVFYTECPCLQAILCFLKGYASFHSSKFALKPLLRFVTSVT
jgi:hypothetical protein